MSVCHTILHCTYICAQKSPPERSSNIPYRGPVPTGSAPRRPAAHAQAEVVALTALRCATRYRAKDGRAYLPVQPADAPSKGKPSVPSIRPFQHVGIASHKESPLVAQPTPAPSPCSCLSPVAPTPSRRPARRGLQTTIHATPPPLQTNPKGTHMHRVPHTPPPERLLLLAIPDLHFGPHEILE